MLSKTVLCCALAAAPAMAYVPGNVGGVLKLKAQSDGVSRRAFLGLGAAVSRMDPGLDTHACAPSHGLWVLPYVTSCLFRKTPSLCWPVIVLAALGSADVCMLSSRTFGRRELL